MDQPERPQRRVMEAAAPIDVTHAQGNMVKHVQYLLADYVLFQVPVAVERRQTTVIH